MVVQQALSMVGGSGETSYANNSSYQKHVISRVRALLEESIKAICLTISPECLNIADLGCSSGPNALSVVQSIIDVVVSTCQSSGHQFPELNVFMNDLPHNDFNSIFKSLPEFYKRLGDEKGVEVPCYISGTPGSFYNRLFPSNLVHFMHSSYSLHWLSQVPKELTGETLHKRCIYASKDSPHEVLKAYQEQFGRDFTKFLGCRSKEIVKDGRVVLSFIGTHDDEANPGLDVTSEALNKLASQGLINKEKLDAFNLPYYRPTMKQVKQLIENQGSFTIHKLESFYVPWDATWRIRAEQDNVKYEVNFSKGAKFMTSTTRAILEPMLASEFGEEIMDQVFRLIEEMLTDSLANGQEIGTFNLAISLIKKEERDLVRMNH